MVKKMKLPFLSKNTSSSSSYNSSLWLWPSCHNQNPKTTSFKASFISENPTNSDEPEPLPCSFSSSCSSSSTSHEKEAESVENVIRRLKTSTRLIFERRGKTKSILEEKEAHEAEDEEKGFMLFSLESNDPYADFKNSMEKMIEAYALHHDWKSLEKLLFWFLKVNVKTNHKYIFAAFVDLLLNLAVEFSKYDVSGKPSSDDVVQESPSSSSPPVSFYTSYSSSDETSSTSVRLLPVNSVGEKSKEVVCCLSSLFEKEEKIKDNSGLSS